MKYYDAVVIGGGVLGCFTARNLCRWKLKTALVEAAEDVCTGITRANAAVVYAGYDHQPITQKATFTLAANAGMDALCEELEVPFLRRGSLMTASGPMGEALLRKKLVQGTIKGVPGLHLLTGDEAREREPMLSPSVTSALFAETTGTVNPWQLGIAAYENALHNGCESILSAPVRAIRHHGEGYLLETEKETISCRMVLNCAGLYADRIQELLFPPRVRIRWDASDFLVLDRTGPTPRHILFQETETGKGITAVPTTEGNLMLVSPARPLSGEPFSTTWEGLQNLKAGVKTLLPGLDLGRTIRCFGGVRPNPVDRDGKNIRSFVMDAPEPGFLSLIGIKTPGLTCADQLGTYLAERTAEYLQAEPNPGFDPLRRAIRRFSEQSEAKKAELANMDPACREILCMCEGITRREVLDAIARGAVTVDGVKRRVGAGMGICQGSRCQIEIEKLLPGYAETRGAL